MVKLEMIKVKLKQTSEAFKQDLEKVESNLKVWRRLPEEKLDVLQENSIIPIRVMYIEFAKFLENKSLVLKELIQEIDDALKLHIEMVQDIVSRFEKISCKIIIQDEELLSEEEVLSDLSRKIHQEMEAEQFSVASIQALVKYQVLLEEVQTVLEKHRTTILSCCDIVIKTVIVAKNTHEPNPDELQGMIQKFEEYMAKRVAL